MHDRLDFTAVLFEQLGDRVRITDVDVVMFVAADVLDQTVPRPFGRGFRAEELRTHVVVDSNHARTLVCEVLHRFRSDQIVPPNHSPTIQVSSPADGFTRAAGYCGSPLKTRSISSECLLALARKQTWRA